MVKKINASLSENEQMQMFRSSLQLTRATDSLAATAHKIYSYNSIFVWFVFFSKISVISKGTQVTRDLAQQIGKLPTAMASEFQVDDVAFSFFPAPPPSLPSAPAPL